MKQEMGICVHFYTRLLFPATLPIAKCVLFQLYLPKTYFITVVQL